MRSGLYFGESGNTNMFSRISPQLSDSSPSGFVHVSKGNRGRRRESEGVKKKKKSLKYSYKKRKLHLTLIYIYLVLMKPQIPWSWRHDWHPGIGFHALVSNLLLPRHTHPEEARIPKDTMLISHHFHCSLTHSSFIAREEVLQITNFQSLIVDLMTAHDIEFVFLIVTTVINSSTAEAKKNGPKCTSS